jgi:hypothetical protein
VATIRDEIQERYPNLHLVGRNGMHKYNNQDHAMMTAMLCVENILADTKLYDLWQVNGDAEYHEAVKLPLKNKERRRDVPTRVTGAPAPAPANRVARNPCRSQAKVPVQSLMRGPHHLRGSG